jgi:ubiquinone/menaquinone biosynthesis C-methylase UbiE
MKPANSHVKNRPATIASLYQTLEQNSGNHLWGDIRMQTFDGFAAKYDSWFTTGLGRYVLETELDVTMMLTLPVKGEKVLDVGTGTGIFASELRKYGADITGIDVSERMIDIAKSKGITNVMTGNAESLDFPDESFDLVISITALEFIKDPQKAVDEMVRVCRKGGRVVVGTLGSGSWWARKRIRAAMKDPESVFRDAVFYSLEELKKMAGNYGYRTTARGAVFSPPYDNVFCVLLGRLTEKLFQRLIPARGAFLIFRIDKI